MHADVTEPLLHYYAIKHRICIKNLFNIEIAVRIETKGNIDVDRDIKIHAYA